MPEAVEMFRCPTCLGLIFDADAKRCPSCRSKLRKRARPTVSVQDTQIADRPLPLVERELQARIEAETASRFRQRRRAAKVARRIASLPPTVFDGDAVIMQAEAEASVPHAPAGSPTVIDLPAEAVHDVSSKASVAEPAEPIVEPVPEPEPVIEANVEPEPEPIPEPVVEVVVEPAPEPVMEAAPADPPPARKRKSRRRSKPARIVGVLAPDVTLEPTPVDEVVEPAPPEVVPEVVVPEVVVPEVVIPEVVPVAEVLEQPAPAEPRVEPTPEPVVEPAPSPAANWQRSNSLWTDRVFNTTPRRPENETVSWPPRWKPETPFVDLTDAADSEADPVDSAAPAD